MIYQLELFYFYIIIANQQVYKYLDDKVSHILAVAFYIFQFAREIIGLPQERTLFSPSLCRVAKPVIRVAPETAVKQHRG